MLNKILDNYYTSKLLEEIKWCFIVRNLDYKFRNEKNRVIIETKHKKYSDKFYSAIIEFNKNESLKYLCNLDKFKEDFVNCIKAYIEKV